MFVWRFLDRSGSTTGSSEPMGNRDAAEAWLTDRWSDLWDRGVSAVELIDTDTNEVVYRMSLADDQGANGG